MKKFYFLMAMMMLLMVSAWSQTSLVAGVVTDAQKQAIAYATVSVKETSVASSADQNGAFTINAALGSTLIITAAGFRPSTVNAGPGKLFITLVNANALDEVVVTAMGISRRTKSLGYSTQQVSGTELTRARELNVVNALAGKVAGVRINSQSGTLGGSSKIIIRGQSSFNDPNGGQPIFVVDGLPIDNSSRQLSSGNSSVPQGTAAIDFGNRAGDINSDDIESINVLKGAAATALYGARAKNGAIIITTKKGAKGKTRVTLNSSTRFDNPLKLPEFQNQYAQGSRGIYNLASTNGWGPKISDVQDLTFPDFLGRQVTLKAYDNNVKDFFVTGNTFLNSVAFDAGGDNGDFRLGYTNSYQTGIVENQNLVRNSINLNAGRIISSKLDVRTTINYVSTTSKGRPYQSSNNPNIISQIVGSLPRTVDIADIKANYIDSFNRQVTLTPGRTGNNPYWVIYNNQSASNVERIYGNAVINYKPFSWLTISNNLGTDMYNEHRNIVTRKGTVGALTGNFFDAQLFNRILNNDLLLRLEKQLTRDITLTALAGQNVYQSQYRRIQSDAQQLTIDQLYTFNNASTVTSSNTSTLKRIMGVYGEIGLSYKDFLFLNVTGRNDWSSTLPVNNRSYFYPSVSGSFVFGQLLQSSILSYGKLRASWANVGSDTDPYLTAFAYLPVSNVYAQYNLSRQFPFNGLTGFSVPNTIPNFNLKPQNQYSFEVGTDLRFFGNRVHTELTYYNSITSDQIVRLAVPQSTGFLYKLVNAGSIKNQGIEVVLGGAVIQSKRFNWDVNLNFSANKQIVQDLPAELPEYNLASGYNSLQYRARNGEQIGLFGVGWERDGDGNFIIDPVSGLRTRKLNTRLGNIYPKWMLGVNNSFSYNGITLSFLIDVRQGGVLYSGSVAGLRSTGLAKETEANRDNTLIDRGVIKDADGKYIPNTVPVQSMQDYWNQFGTDVTEGGVFDASFVKLREVQIYFALPSKMFSESKFIKGIDFGVEGRNLWIIHDNVPHIDPEVNIFGTGSVGEGFEFFSAPSTRTIGFNIKARF